MLRLLPVLDDLERAMDSVRAELAGLHWVQGDRAHQSQIAAPCSRAKGSSGSRRMGQAFDPR